MTRPVTRKSNVPLYLATLLGLAVYAGGTYAVVQAAGGTEIRPEESNTPNHVVPGPPGVVPEVESYRVPYASNPDAPAPDASNPDAPAQQGETSGEPTP